MNLKDQSLNPLWVKNSQIRSRYVYAAVPGEAFLSKLCVSWTNVCRSHWTPIRLRCSQVAIEHETLAVVSLSPCMNTTGQVSGSNTNSGEKRSMTKELESWLCANSMPTPV